jgi:hypothetical protein
MGAARVVVKVVEAGSPPGATGLKHARGRSGAYMPARGILYGGRRSVATIWGEGTTRFGRGEC